MNRLATRWRGKLPIPQHAHPLVRRLIRQLNIEQTTLSEVAERAGLSVKTISDWRYRREPTLSNFEAALNVMDLELRVVKRQPGEDWRPADEGNAA